MTHISLMIHKDPAYSDGRSHYILEITNTEYCHKQLYNSLNMYWDKPKKTWYKSATVTMPIGHVESWLKSQICLNAMWEVTYGQY